LTTLSLHTHISTQWTDGCSTGCGKPGIEAAKQEPMKWEPELDIKIEQMSEQ